MPHRLDDSLFKLTEKKRKENVELHTATTTTTTNKQKAFRPTCLHHKHEMQNIHICAIELIEKKRNPFFYVQQHSLRKILSGFFMAPSYSAVRLSCILK